MATPAGEVETPGETIPGALASPPPTSPLSPPVVRALEPEFGGMTETPVAETQMDSPDTGTHENHGLGQTVLAGAEKPAPAPSSRVRDILKANKMKKETSASALHQAILALGPPGQLTKEQLAAELLNLHEQMHGNESPGTHETAGDKAVGKPLEETPEKVLQNPLPKSMPPPAKVPNKPLCIAGPPPAKAATEANPPVATPAVVEAKPATPPVTLAVVPLTAPPTAVAAVEAEPAAPLTAGPVGEANAATPPTTLAVVHPKTASPTALAVVNAKPAAPAPLTASAVAEAKAASPLTAPAAPVGSTSVPANASGPDAVANPGATAAPAGAVAPARSVAPAGSTDKSVEQQLMELRPYGPMGLVMHGKGYSLD